MPLRGRVGRHTKDGGRHCQNWPDDQDAVIALLNRIPVEDGGTGGRGNIGARVVAGIASDALYRAIVTFEDKHFPRQRSGFVDPGGAMLRRMEELAARSTKVAANRLPDPIVLSPLPSTRTSIDELLDKVFFDGPWERYPTSQKNAFARLVGLAVVYLKTLKDQGMTGLPYQVVLFGRAYITKDVMPTMVRGSLEFIGEGGKSTQPPPVTERYGGPVDIAADITTADSGALLLYDSTLCYRVFPYHTGRIMHLALYSPHSWSKAQPLKP